MKKIPPLVFVAIAALVPMTCFAESRSVVDAAARGLATALLVIPFALLIHYLRRKDKERAAVEASKSELARTCANGQLKKVIALVDAGADVNEQDENGGTALMLAARNNRLSVAMYLLEHGAKTDLKTKSGTSASDIAMNHGNGKIMDAIALRNKERP